MPLWRAEIWPPDSFEAEALYLRPIDLMGGAGGRAACKTGAAQSLAGGPLAFRNVELIARGAAGVRAWQASLREVREWAEERGGYAAKRIARLEANLTYARPPFANVSLDHPHLFGILNVTPDSFSDGGDYVHPDRAIAYGGFLTKEGAAIVDIGGESTRPGAEPVGVEEEIARVLPVIGAIASQGAIISIDSRHADVMAAALDAGALVLNDVTALTHESASLALATERRVPVVLMHKQGDPRTMQDAPDYDDVVLDIFDYLEARVAACEEAGIVRGNLCVDPGIGFGKTLGDNLEILGKLSLFQGLGTAVMVGVSRKSFLLHTHPGLEPKERLAASIAAGLGCLNQGVQFLRVHDIPESAQALRVWLALRNGKNR